MRKIMSKEPVVIPDGHGGVLETIYVEVPATQNEETGEVFLDDDALGMLDHVKAFRMSGYSVELRIQPLEKSGNRGRTRKSAPRERVSRSRPVAYA